MHCHATQMRAAWCCGCATLPLAPCFLSQVPRPEEGTGLGWTMLLSWAALAAETITSLAVARLVSDIALAGGSLSAALFSGPAITRSAAIILFAQAGRHAVHQWAPLVPSHTSTRLLLLIGGHLCACAIDCHVHAPTLGSRHFLRCLALASIYVAPVAPLLAVGGSTLLMVLTSCLQTFIADADLTSLHAYLDLGALHAPFWFVHMRTRTLVARRNGVLHEPPLLPVVAHHPAGSNNKELVALRKQRLSCYCGSSSTS